MNSTVNRTTSYPKIMPPTVLLVAVLLMLGLHFLLPVTQIVPGIWRLQGLLPLCLGLAISFASEKQFHQAGTTVHPFKESSRLVTDGLYRFSRNPMYLGMALILVGVALLLGSLTPFGVVAIFVGWIQFQFIRREEQMLYTQFGQDWLEYRARVRRWI
jgi:protein-S-isoprenylcysteine O-methyltransferase Ste14